MDLFTENQTIEKRMELRRKYAKLLEEANEISPTAPIQESCAKIDRILNEAGSLINEVRTVPELFLDAKVINASTSSLQEIAKNVDVGEGVFKMLSFAEQIKSKALDSSGTPRYNILAKAATLAVHTNSLPNWNYWLGSFDITSEELRASQRQKKPRKKDPEAEKKEPEKVTELDDSRKGTEEIVQEILHKLKKHYKHNHKQPMHFYKFIVNPHSFAKTVENLFHVSFLIHDGHAKMEIIDGEPMISPLKKATGKENSSPSVEIDGRPRHQNILTMDMSDWENLIIALEIKTAMI